METTYPGSRGPTVELVQLALQRAGAISAPPDGIFGPVTGAAVRASSWIRVMYRLSEERQTNPPGDRVIRR